MAQRLRNEGWPRGGLVELVTAFANDVLCCHNANAMDHFQPQSAFARYSTTGIDVVINLDAADDGRSGLAEVARLAGNAHRTRDADKCRLLTLNSQKKIFGFDLPSSSALRR